MSPSETSDELQEALEESLDLSIASSETFRRAVARVVAACDGLENASLRAAIKEHQGLVQQYTYEQTRIAQAKTKLWDLKRQTLETRLENKELAGELEKLREECIVVPSSVRALRSEERGLKYRIAILRNVLLALIHESGCDWANDAQMLQLVVSLQKTLPSSEP